MSTWEIATAVPASANVRLSSQGAIGLLTIDSPPVNALGQAVICGMEQALDAFEAERGLKGLVVRCEGRTFVAGGDIAEFDSAMFSTAPLNALLARIEQLDRPVVAALHGFTLGGGLELAMACHWRVAAPDTRIGLPEIRLGIIPGSLGTQRLPRLVGAAKALAMIRTGESVTAQQALQDGLIDAVCDGPMDQAAAAFLLAKLEAGPSGRATSLRTSDAGQLPPSFWEEAQAVARARALTHPEQLAAVQAVQASALPFAEGEQVEAALFQQLVKSQPSRARRHLFFAQREAAKVPGVDAAPQQISTAVVLGAGTMGRGIAMSLLNAGLQVALVDTTQQVVDAAAASIRDAYETAVARGKLAASEAQARLARLAVTTRHDETARADLVIEAVFEDMQLKRTVWQWLGGLCKPDAILATNTSTLDVDVLAEVSGRPGNFVGTHFFSPAHVMRLLEVVRGRGTSPGTLATILQLARRINKVPVVSGVCYGFIGNRMAEVYMREAEFLLMEGATPRQVDGAMEAFGMAMGPCRMLDMAGVDVGAKTVIEYGKAGGLPPDPSYRAMVRKLYEAGRHGQKSGAGYYRYEGRTAVPDPEVVHLAGELAARHGIRRRDSIEAQEIVERLLYPMINEAARILDEGIAYRPGDIDVVWTTGYGFPEHRGGPVFLADETGVRHVVERLHHYGELRGNGFGYWTVSALLLEIAQAGGRMLDWRRKS